MGNEVVVLGPISVASARQIRQIVIAPEAVRSKLFTRREPELKHCAQEMLAAAAGILEIECAIENGEAALILDGAGGNLILRRYAGKTRWSDICCVLDPTQIVDIATLATERRGLRIVGELLVVDDKDGLDLISAAARLL